MGLTNTFHQIYFKSTGHSFTNMGRMFLRLFVGLMLSQFGVRQLMQAGSGYDTLTLIPYLEWGLATWLVIVVELICSFCIMIGLFMRAMLIPPFVLMIASCHKLVVVCDSLSAVPSSLMCIPFMFMGIFMFLFLVGPGKVSLDYFFSLYLISRHHNGKEEDLEEV